MRIKNTAFAYNVTVNNHSNCDWGTDIGQGKKHTFTLEGFPDFINAMVYYKIEDTENIQVVLGRGNRTPQVFAAYADVQLVLASRFEKVFINNTLLEGQNFVVYILKETNEYDSNGNVNIHKNRCTLKFSDSLIYRGQALNQGCIEAISDYFHQTNNGSWAILEMNIENEDELHFYGFALGDAPKDYSSTNERNRDFENRFTTEFSRPTQHLSFVFSDKEPLQKIVYGAPGTGKSFGTDGIINGRYPDVAEREKNVIRTTFHPDSDYSTFVGCYKPTKEKPLREDYSAVELKLLYKEFKKTCGTRPEHKFAGRYYASLENLSKDEWKSVFEGSAESVIDAEINKAIAAARSFDEATVEAKSTITYSFVPQAFTKAYCRAYELLEEQKPVFLVIEEINRGNCAQIFGDIFQLLDRNEMGWSKYEIKPDTDLDQYLQEHCPGYNSDKGMKLPPNLYIWATMNTSDQSLFPIDSAFKRRWDWEYVPIDYTKGSKYIEVNGKKYDWGDFLQKINDAVYEATESEDKMMGYYFACPNSDCVDAQTFVNKVVFYLWNDVFKDNDLPSAIFKDGTAKDFAFRKFFGKNGKPDPIMVQRMLENLGVALWGQETDENSQESDSEEDKRKTISVTIDGVTFVEKDKQHFDFYLDIIDKIGADDAGRIIEASSYYRVNPACKLATLNPDQRLLDADKGFSYVQKGSYFFVKGINVNTMVNVLKYLQGKVLKDLEVTFE